MRRAFARTLFALALATATLAAQGTKPGKPKPAKSEPAAATKTAPKDDALTAKDAVVVALDKFIARTKVDKKRDDWRTTLTAPPKQTFTPDRDYLWHLATSQGELTIRFLPAVAPMHVTSAIYLTRLGFYDGLTFHRVIKGFMAQGGCPLGTGSGGPGYTLEGEFDGKTKHDKPGLLSMANEENKPKTDGSQFFLTFAPAPHLDGKHTIFGEMIQGTATLQAIEERGGTGDEGKPTARLVIERAWLTVVEKPEQAGQPATGAGK